MRKGEKTGLGRGLSTLLGEVDGARATTSGGPRSPAEVSIDLLDANPDQPRRSFDDDDIAELSASIAARGVIQPIVVRPHPTNPKRYQIVAGERRWRAAQRAAIHDVPVVIRELDDKTVLEVAIVENVQRVDLNALEEAQGYAQLVERFSYTQADLAQTVGKSRSHIANLMRLLALPDSVQDKVRSGSLSAGHARALLGAEDAEQLAEQVVKQGLSVRQVEKLAREARAPQRKSIAKVPEKDPDTRLLEQDLSNRLGMSVTIDHATDGSGRVSIRYKDIEALDRLCAALTD